MSLDWIFFDLDGTLWDHERAVAYGVGKVAERYGLAPITLLPAFLRASEEIWRNAGAGNLDFEALMVRRFEIILDTVAGGCCSLDAEEVGRFYLSHYLGRRSVLPGAEEVIRLAASRARLAVLTNGSRLTQIEKVQQFGEASAHFEFIHCFEDAGTLKPDARFFLTAAERAGAVAPERVLMVGDVEAVDCLPVLGLGWKSALVNSSSPAFASDGMQVLPGLPELLAFLEALPPRNGTLPPESSPSP